MTTIQTGYTHISQRYKAEDEKPFEFQLLVEVVSLENASGDPGFLVCLTAAICPEFQAPDKLSSIAETCGISPEDVTIEDVEMYGLSCNIENAFVLLEEDAEQKANEYAGRFDVYGMLCGFYFDKAQNKIGNTGWDFLRGRIN